MSDQGRLAVRTSLSVSKEKEADTHEIKLLIATLVMSGLIWLLLFLSQDWRLSFLVLIPTFLTFNSRRRRTIMIIGAANMSAVVAYIVLVLPHTAFKELEIIPKDGTHPIGELSPVNFFVIIIVILLLSIIYFALRQSRILGEEQRKRVRRDAELVELENAFTALDLSQRALHRMTSLLAENAPVAIAQLTPEMSYTMVNPMYLNLLRNKYGNESLDLIGENFSEHCVLTNSDEECEDALAMIQNGMPVKLSAQASQAHFSGKVSYWDWTIWPVKDEAGVTESVLLLGAEVTERIRAERKLEDALTELENSNLAKDTFLATLSHELRTPLTPILGWAKIIQDPKADVAVTSQGLQAIERNARLQSQLVDDLLDLSRITMGKIKLLRAAVDLNEIVSRALETVHSRVSAQNLRLKIELNPDPLMVYGDATRLEQIIWNLLSNAVKFTPVGGQIEIRSRRSGNNCELSVTDSGIGIDPAVLPKLFEPFKQADSSITRRHGGLGIGLAIARSLVEMHGGVIDAQSSGQGSGACFSIRLPIYIAGHHRLLKSLTKSQSVSLTGVKALILEDSFDTRELLGVILEANGCLVSLAESVAEAMQKVCTFEPDIIISDIGLPDEDGYGFIRQLRKTIGFEHTPVIALTGYAMDTDRQKAFASGFDQHLSKPVDPVALINTIQELRSRMSEQQTTVLSF